MAVRLCFRGYCTHFSCKPKLFQNRIFERAGYVSVSHTYCTGITGHAQIDKSLNTLTGGRVVGWLQRYEDFVGLTDVKEAQFKVTEAEKQFVASQSERRSCQERLSNVHQRLQTLAGELERVPRGDDRYLALVRDEVTAVRDCDRLRIELADAETAERASFGALSSAVRSSHERERVRAERTKYWSVAGSLIGAAIGIVGTSINNYLRMRELRSMVSANVAGGSELRQLVTQLAHTVDEQHAQVRAFVADVRASVSGVTPRPRSNQTPIPAAEAQSAEIVEHVREQGEKLTSEMNELKAMLAASSSRSAESGVIYVGPQISEMLDDNEQRLEWKMKMNTIYTVTFIYTAFALTLPVLYGLFSQS